MDDQYHSGSRGHEEQAHLVGRERHVVGGPGGIAGIGDSAQFFGESGDTFGHLATTVLPDYLLNTVLLMLLVGAIALMIGVPTAWLTARYRFPGSRVFPLLLVLPLAAPAMSWAMFMRICLITPAPCKPASERCWDCHPCHRSGHCLAQRWSLRLRYIPTFFYWRG